MGSYRSPWFCVEKQDIVCCCACTVEYCAYADAHNLVIDSVVFHRVHGGVCTCVHVSMHVDCFHLHTAVCSFA